MLDQYYRVWSEIDLDAIKTNISNMKSLTKNGTKACAVIKADGYGHGAAPIAKATTELVDYYAVATIDEALNLRAHEIFLPILVIGFVHKSKYKAAIENDIRLTVFNYEMALEIEKAAKAKNKKALIHLKLDTGMNRLGLPCTEAGLDTALQIAALENIEIEGIFTHLYLSDAHDKSLANAQVERFGSFCGKLEEQGVTPAIKHCSNSAAAIEMADANFDMVRLGIALYGLYPSDEITSLKLLPAFSLKSHIVMVKEIAVGETVGYGATFKADRPVKIATITIGYADGYQRNLSNKADVLVKGKRAPIAGRVCMDMIMVDVTDIPDVKEGDEVVLIGKQGEEEITVEELALISGTFNYEFVCDISKRVPRTYFMGGQMVAFRDYFFDIYS